MGIARFAAIADWPLVRVRLRPLESQRAASRGDVPGTLWECGASLEGGESLPGRLARHVSYIISSHEQKHEGISCSATQMLVNVSLQENE